MTATPDQPPTRWTVDDKGVLVWVPDLAAGVIWLRDLPDEAYDALALAVRDATEADALRTAFRQARDLAAEVRAGWLLNSRTAPILELLELLAPEAGAVTRAEGTPTPDHFADGWHWAPGMPHPLADCERRHGVTRAEDTP